MSKGIDILRDHLLRGDLTDLDRSRVVVAMATLAEAEDADQQRQIVPKRSRRPRSADNIFSKCVVCDFPVSQLHHIFPFHVVGDEHGNRTIAFCPNCHTIAHMLESYGKSEIHDAKVFALLDAARNSQTLTWTISQISRASYQWAGEFKGVCQRMEEKTAGSDREAWWNYEYAKANLRECRLRCFLAIVDISEEYGLRLDEAFTAARCAVATSKASA